MLRVSNQCEGSTDIMLVSTKGRYALRVMVDLAEHREEGRIPLRQIAVRQDISEKYLENIRGFVSSCG